VAHHALSVPAPAGHHLGTRNALRIQRKAQTLSKLCARPFCLWEGWRPAAIAASERLRATHVRIKETLIHLVQIEDNRGDIMLDHKAVEEIDTPVELQVVEDG
jgi:hypothetical protein